MASSIEGADKSQIGTTCGKKSPPTTAFRIKRCPCLLPKGHEGDHRYEERAFCKRTGYGYVGTKTWGNRG